MAKPRRPGGPKQKLSPAAAKKKAARDLRIAKTPRRTKMRNENQKKRRAAAKNGQSVKGKDYDHNRGRFVSEKTNRSATKTTNNTLSKAKDSLKTKAKKAVKSLAGKAIKGAVRSAAKSQGGAKAWSPKRPSTKVSVSAKIKIGGAKKKKQAKKIAQWNKSKNKK